MGAMMYELMTGTPPFGNHGGILQKNGADIPLIEENYTQELKNIVYACLAKEPWDRPSAKKIEELTYNKLHGIVTPTEKPEIKPAEPVVSEPIVEKPVFEKPIDKKPFTEKAPAAEPKQPKQSKQAKPVMAKGPKPITPKKGINKNIIIGAVAALVVLIGIIAMCSGGGESKEAEPAVSETPRINYDSIAQIKIQEAMMIKENADTTIQNHPDEYTDASIYNKVEEFYMTALNMLGTLPNRDSLSNNVSNYVIQQQTDIQMALMNIYKNLDASAEYVPEFRTRADSIKPYILDLINSENQDNDEDQHDDE
jgi:serine/threonine protein kinase